MKNKKDLIYIVFLDRPKIYNKIDNKSQVDEIYHEKIVAEKLLYEMNETTT